MISLFGVEFYHANRCQICKNSSNLKTCGNCKSISYCSEEHQIAHWPKHKNLCKLILATDYMIPVDTDFVKYQNIIAKIKWSVIQIWRLKLQRNTTIDEEDLLFYRKSCIICNSKNCKFQCGECLSAFYCTLEHQKVHEEKHKTFCALLKLNFNLLLFNYENMLCVPKFSGKNLKDELTKLPETVTKLQQVFNEESYVVFGKEITCLAEFSIVDNLFVPVANIIFGLEKGNLLNNRLFIKTELIIHIVGASTVEGKWNWDFLIEFMFHWIKNVEKVKFFCVGPNANGLTNSSVCNYNCGICKKKQSIGQCTSYPVFYHEVADSLKKPDIIIGFNSGLCVFPSWIPSIPSITKYKGVPLVLTNYTLDRLEKDIQAIHNNTLKKLDFLLKPQRNPFSCVSPERGDLINCPILYKNGYISVLVAK